MIKLSACVVLYNPENETFDNIITYGNYVDKLIVIDNSTNKNEFLINKLNIFFNDKLVYINNNCNLGIATALNLACDKAISLRFNWILTMDQDSSFINFEHYKQCLFNLNNYNDIGLLAANTTRGALEKLTKNQTFEYEEKLIVITSSNIINLKYFNKVGRFDDKLFIDMVDYDFCAKIIKANLKILYFKDVLVEHSLGEIHLRKNILTGKEKYKIEHNAQRVYYIARNSLYLSKKYRKIFPKEFGLLKNINIIFIHDVTKILLYEEDKLRKIKAKIIGLFHFFINKFGKFDITKGS
ncbi:glycosyltransferase [Aliarcobacter lanthieri]|uniref:glycosyltransferase n=1 Tax=Aliarcobacter lanthieri TaxID=1355374 RepID=UPI001923DC27|nr:glycosyltransferase [Aliarcobacter lanthieri]MBL3519334.1 glycosyltransferase [Aliarcobacter lanthieri]